MQALLAIIQAFHPFESSRVVIPDPYWLVSISLKQTTSVHKEIERMVSNIPVQTLSPLAPFQVVFAVNDTLAQVREQGQWSAVVACVQEEAGATSAASAASAAAPLSRRFTVTLKFLVSVQDFQPGKNKVHIISFIYTLVYKCT